MKTLIRLFSAISLLAVYSISQADLPSCISKHFAGKTVTHKSIIIDAPDIAENGSVVSIGVKGLKNIAGNSAVREISFFNEFRTEPVARFLLGQHTHVTGLKTRMRLRESSNIYAVAILDNGQLISGESFVKVTISGCGGGGMPQSSEKIKRVCNKNS